MTTAIESSKPDDDFEVDGPRGWKNWRGYLLGQPLQDKRDPDSVILRPIWEEFALYSDAPFSGELIAGPYHLINPLADARLGVGRRRLALVLRAQEHLFAGDPLPIGEDVEKGDRAGYHGGDHDDEMAALLGLALGRRVRSGGRTRRRLVGEGPEGSPDEGSHQPPALEPARWTPMIPTVANPADMGSAAALFSSYPHLQSRDAVALVRAASAYVEGLWLADADPRQSWLRLVNALEAAAVARDRGRHSSPMAQLKKWNRRLHRLLADLDEPVATAIAEDIGGLYQVQQKCWSFLKAYLPDPPADRPPVNEQVDWRSMQTVFGTVYAHRSADLHSGIPIPAPLCSPEGLGAFSAGRPPERFTAIASATGGGEWVASELPIHLNLFAHVVGGALRNWWADLDPKDHRDPRLSGAPVSRRPGRRPA